MSKVHYEKLRQEINLVLKKYPNIVDEYERGLFPRSEGVKDLQLRFNFDLLHGSGLAKWVCDELYPYLNDNHIKTALNSICPKLIKKY